VGNSKKAQKILGWTPAHDFQMMINKIVQARKTESI
jgi:GDP-D-mannose dehydratase